MMQLRPTASRLIRMTEEQPTIAICCSTFHRHEGLKLLLQSLDALELKEPRPAMRIVVTNNDPEDREPSRIVEEWNAGGGLQADYLDEPRRGLSFPRNRAIEHTIDAYDYIAFIDDDSTARPDWLQQLLDVRADTGADVVTGPVAPVYETTPPDWIVEGGFFAPAVRETGRSLDRAFTNNVLITTESIRRTDTRFDPEIALFGSEDTLFFKTMTSRGARIVWAADALVDDSVPTARATSDWLIMRHKRTGMCNSVGEMKIRGRALATPSLLARGLVWTVLGCGLLLLGIGTGNKARRVRARCWLAWGRGLILGMLGRNYAEYLHER